MRSLARVMVLAFAAFGAVTLSASSAPAAGDGDKGDDRAVCADAYRTAQTQRRGGALVSARKSLLVCVSDRCPSMLHADCTRWLTEVELAMPSVTFAAKGEDGKDVSDARVFLDGELIADTLDGKALSVDPGSHAVKFERSGAPPIEQTIVTREGEKARVISVSWLKRTSVVEPLPEKAAPAASGAPAIAWVLGAVGIAGVGAFGVLAIHGLGRRSDLEKECFGRCQQGEVDSIKTEFAIADVALGVGVVSLGIATALFLSGKPSTASGQRRSLVVRF